MSGIAGATGGDGVMVRPAEPRDVAALGALGAELVRLHHGFDAARFIDAGPGTAQGYADFLATRLEAPEAVVLVAELAGEVVGYAFGEVEGMDWMSLRGPAAVLHDLIVAPDARGRGAGRALADALMTALAARGAPRFVLQVAERNPLAQGLFARMGFRRTLVEMTREAGGS